MPELYIPSGLRESIADSIRADHARLIASERERCAKVALQYALSLWGGGTWDEARAAGAEEVAKRIRALK